MAKILEMAGRETTIKRLLRKRNTHEYYKEDGWTDDPGEAKCFLDVVEVAETCVRRRLDNVELTLRIEAKGCDFFCTPFR